MGCYFMEIKILYWRRISPSHVGNCNINVGCLIFHTVAIYQTRTLRSYNQTLWITWWFVGCQGHQYFPLSVDIQRYVNHALSNKSLSVRSRNPLSTSSCNHLQYELLAFQFRGKRSAALIFVQAQVYKSCCHTDWGFWHSTLNSQSAHRFWGACYHLSVSIIQFIFV
jgi:hypothetical protein